MLAETFLLRGDLTTPRLPPWIERHARRLGLSARITERRPDAITVEVAGPPDLLDALEMGCLLGPIDAWVDSIQRAPLTRAAA